MAQSNLEHSCSLRCARIVSPRQPSFAAAGRSDRSRAPIALPIQERLIRSRPVSVTGASLSNAPTHRAEAIRLMLPSRSPARRAYANRVMLAPGRAAMRTDTTSVVPATKITACRASATRVVLTAHLHSLRRNRHGSPHRACRVTVEPAVWIESTSRALHSAFVSLIEPYRTNATNGRSAFLAW